MSCFAKQLHMTYRLTALLAALLLCASLWVPAVAANTPYSGNIGPVKWSVSGGTLTITGKGAIPDFTERDPAPWSGHSDVISRVELDSSITRIGAMAFYNHALIKSVSLPNSVNTVGEMAFAGCEALTTVVMPKVTFIESYAFSRCTSLDGVVLPETLTALGDHAFYWCQSLTYIRIPASVTELGRTVFGYCSALLRVDIAAPVEQLPDWFFYGCERLESVILPPKMSGAGEDAFTLCSGLHHIYYTGDDNNLDNLIEDITQSLPNFSVGNISSILDSQIPATDHDVIVQGNEMKVTETEVSTDTDLAVRVEQTLTHPIAEDGGIADPDEIDTTIYATITGSEGWNAVIDVIKKEEKEHSTFELEHGTQPPVEVQIFLPKDSVISGEWLSDMRGRDAVITVTTADGSRWSIDCSMLKGLTFKNSYDLRYTLTPYDEVSEEHRKVVGSAACFWVTFSEKIDFPVMVEMFLDPLAVRQTATLYEDVWMNGLQQLQSVLIGQDGTAAFRMGNVNKGKRYVVALNVSGVTAENAVIPDNLAGEYGELDTYVPITDQYIITDVRGFLGMTMKEFTIVLACAVGGLAVVIAVVILVLSIISKRRTLRDVLSESQK